LPKTGFEQKSQPKGQPSVTRIDVTFDPVARSHASW
jgi:hypothetical protein